MSRMEGKVALVTGGGSGIGRAASLRFAEEGATVVVTGRNGANCGETVELISAAGGEAAFVTHDVTSEESWIELAARAVADHGGIDVLVNNAGLYLISPIAETTLEEWNEMMAANVTGTFLGIKHCSPPIAERGGGSIINISSVAGMIGAAGIIAYGAAKGAVRTMTKDAAIELAPQRVRVNSVHPGFVKTAMAEYGAEKFGTTVDGLSVMYPLGRIGEPGDVAELLLFLASDESSWVTGAEHVIDGGSTAGITVADATD